MKLGIYEPQDKVYQLPEILRTEISQVLFKANTLAGCNITNTIGSKLAAMKVYPKKKKKKIKLNDFGEDILPLPDSTKVTRWSNRT